MVRDASLIASPIVLLPRSSARRREKGGSTEQKAEHSVVMEGEAIRITPNYDDDFVTVAVVITVPCVPVWSCQKTYPPLKLYYYPQ